MADFETKPDGEVDDRIRIGFKGIEVRTFENYTVKIAVLQQPAAFSVRLGGVEQPKELFARYPSGTAFSLSVGPVPCFTGKTDGYSSTGGGGTTVVLKGRDILAKLHDAKFRTDKSYVDVTYAELVYEVMLEAGGLEEAALLSSNDANVIVRSGVGTTTKLPPAPKATPEGGGPSPAGANATEQRQFDINDGAKLGIVGVAQTSSAPRHTIHAKLGEKCLEFLKKHLDKAGVMLWADAAGDVVVSAPNVLQPPRYRFVRQRGQLRNAVNVEDHNFVNDTTKRVSSVVVYSRGPGRKAGKGKIRGEFIDQEMVALGINRAEAVRDVNVFDEAQAVKYARAKLAEINRGAWHLTYTISGHTAPTGNGNQRVVITPDTVAQIEDDELGISGLFYVEAVEYSAPPTTTNVTFMRLQDCFFEKDPTIVEQIEKVNSGKKRRRKRKK